MNWDKKSVTATLICFLFVMGYMYYLQNKYPDYYAGAQKTEESPPQNEPVKAGDTAAVASGVSPENAPAPVVEASTVTPLTAAELVFDTKNTIVRFDQSKAGIQEIRLKDYLARKDDSEMVNLLDAEMIVQGTPVLTSRTPRTGWAAKREGQKITFTKADGTWEVTQTYTVPTEGYGLEVDVSFKNISATEQELNATSLIKQELKVPEKSSNFLVPSSPSDVGMIYGLGGSRKDKTIHDLCEKEAEPFASLKSEKVDYAGFDKHYFLGLLWAKNQAADYLIERDTDAAQGHCQISTMITQKFGMVAPGAVQTMKLSGYFGPKKVETLEAVDPALKSTVKLGWFSFFAHPLLLALKGVHQAVQNWGLAIIFVTIILKLAFYPLTRAAAISQKRMQRLQPEMNAIREKHKADPQRQQREIMAFMSQN
ncbi:MAG: membrane protein insertase YidC, partial [Bdellovibrionota bacterium]